MTDVQKVKDAANKLEQSQEIGNSTALNSTIDELNRLTDSQIERSRQAWEEYEKLERECKTGASHPAQLDELKGTCKKSEELAADLLCYSLGRFRPS